jgi:succinoglycan biosynthesis transport protein ExoP
MNPSQFLLILRAHYKIIALALIVTVAATLAMTLLKNKTYKATTSLVLNYKGTDPVTGIAMPSQLLPGYISTQVDIVNSMSVALKVVDALQLASDPKVEESFQNATDGEGNVRDWVAAGLLGKLEVAPSRESSVLNITILDFDPQQAAALANAFGAAYQQMSVQLKVEPSKRTALYFNEQIKVLRDDFEAAQKKLSRYQQDNGIVNADKSLDVESMRLNELSSRLVIAQGLSEEAASRYREAQGNGAAKSPDVASNVLIQNLKLSLSNVESKFAEIGQRLSVNHPQYQSAKAEVDQLRGDLNRQITAASNAIGTNSLILQQRTGEARAALEQQKIKVLELNRARDELAILGKEVESAQRAYETVAQRLLLTNLEGQSNQSDVAVLTPALAPMQPFGPKILLNTLLALVVGTLLGVGAAVLIELLDRRVRSADDLADAVGFPVLGFIKKTHAAARQSSGSAAPAL